MNTIYKIDGNKELNIPEYITDDRDVAYEYCNYLQLVNPGYCFNVHETKIHTLDEMINVVVEDIEDKLANDYIKDIDGNDEYKEDLQSLLKDWLNY